MNNRWKIRISDPLLRPGMEIETEVSENYLGPAVAWGMTVVRALNDGVFVKRGLEDTGKLVDAD